MRLTQFGIVTLPELNGQDALSFGARSNLLPLKYGAIDLDGMEAVLNPNQISRTATIDENYDGDLDDTMQNLAIEAQKGTRVLIASMRDETQRQTLAKMTQFSRSSNAQNYTCNQEYGLTWTMTYPYWLASDDEPIYTDMCYETDTGLTTNGNFETITIGSSPSVDFSINNTSNIRIAKIDFTFLITNTITGFGYIENPRVTNHNNGMYFEVDRRLAYGNANNIARIDVNCLSKKVFGSYIALGTVQPAEYNLYQYVKIGSNQMDWMILEPGINNFTITSTISGGATRTLYVDWSRHYV